MPTLLDEGVEDRRVLIAGGSSGIGAATAVLFAERGARVAIMGRNLERLESVAKACGAFAVPSDVSDLEQVSGAVATVADELGGVDCVVNSAGVMRESRVAEGFVQDWVDLYGINVLSILYLTRAALPYLRASSAADMVNVASISARAVSRPQTSVYSSSKAAATLLTHGLRTELAAFGIRVSAVLPGTTNTEGLGPGIHDTEFRDQLVEYRRTSGMPAAFVAEQIYRAVALPRNASIPEVVIRPFHEG